MSGKRFRYTSVLAGAKQLTFDKEWLYEQNKYTLGFFHSDFNFNFVYFPFQDSIRILKKYFR